jgi:hypothetical protein
MESPAFPGILTVVSWSTEERFMSTEPPTTMTSPVWLAAAHAWIGVVAAQQGRSVIGPIELIHQRPWSTVLRTPTDAGDWYFKAVAPLLAHEISLTRALVGWVPGTLPPVLAVDESRGWLLMADGGIRLREVIRADRDLGHWERILPTYAKVQMALAHHVTELLAMGVPDRRLWQFPQLYEQLLADLPELGVDSAEALTAGQYQQLQAAIPYVSALCAELADYPIPATLHHGDLHDGNIFLRGNRPLFFDWGDASISHPFVSLRTVFVSVEISFDLPDGGAIDLPFRDAYLRAWTEYASMTDLVAAFRLSQRLASIVSALSWYRAVAPLAEGPRREQGLAIHYLLQEFLDGLT